MSIEHVFQPKMLGIICNWCCYGGADLCGVSRFQYPPHIRLVRVMCSARVDLLHILRAFSNGQDAVFIGGCHLCDCHYVTGGNFNAFSMVQVARKILAHIGIHPERLRIEWVSAGEGIRFANFMNEFGAEIEKLGPIGISEGIDRDTLGTRFESVRRLTPFVKLVITQKLRLMERTEEAYYSFFSSKEFDRLFQDIIADKLTTSQIVLLLEDGPLTTGEISQRLGLSSSDVSRHLKRSASQGLVRFDLDERRFTLA